MKLNLLLLMLCAFGVQQGMACVPEVPSETTEPSETTAESTAGETTAAETTPETTAAETTAAETTAAETTEEPSDPIGACLGDEVQCKEFKNGKGTRAETGDELECDFDGAKGCDCWANHEPDEDQNEWVECSGKVDPKKVEECFKTKDVPSGKFVSTFVTTKQESGAQAILFSCTIGCAMGGSMTVKQWTLNADLKVCAQSRLDALAAPICQEFSGDGAQTIEFLPAGQKFENFDVQLTASDFIGDDGGIAIADDIKLYLDECVDTTVPTEPTTKKPKKTTKKPKATKAPKETEATEPTEGTTPAGTESPSEDACLLTCGPLPDDQPCDAVWNFDEQEGEGGTWQVYEESIGNFDSGTPLPDEGKFYGCLVGPGETCQMNTKNPINLQGHKFRVKHYDATEGAQFRLCVQEGETEDVDSERDCGIKSDVFWSVDDLDWNTLFTDFDQSQITEDTNFHVICDNSAGINYGTCGFTRFDVFDADATEEKEGDIVCT